MNKEPELKLCPFCGESAIQHRTNLMEFSPGEWSLNHDCENGASPSNITFYADTRQGCIDAWNKRVEPAKEPLTLEELRGMDGEPLKHWVWIEFITRPEKSGYMRSHSDFTGGKCFCCGWPGVGYTLEYEEYGKTWLAYRRKPGGSEK